MALRSQARALPVLGIHRSICEPSSAAYVEEAIGYGGHLSRALPGYEARPGQIRMALAVHEAIEAKKHLFAEAPCGVGKGVAYLVPAIRHAVERGRKVVVVTAKINLQDQLVRKDLPLLRRTLPTPFTFAVAKGRANYLCTEAFEENDGTVRDKRWADVVEWASVTQTGDVGELPFEPGPLRKSFTVSAEDCLGKACPSREACWAERAKEACAGADVVVTNYHLFLLDLMIRSDPEAEGPLPVWDVAVLDECFPAGTMIDGVPIEDVRVGDLVSSYDEAARTFVRRQVTRLFVSKPSALLRLRFGERVIVCTPGHPFLTNRGWVPASSLHVGDFVLSSKDAKDPCRDAVCDLRSDGLRLRKGDVRREAQREGVLLNGAQQRRKAALCGEARQGDRDQVRRRVIKANEAVQSDVRPRNEGESLSHTTSDRSPPARSWRERDRAFEAASGASQPARQWLDSRALDRNGEGRHFEVRSEELHGGSRSSCDEDRGRDRRGFSQVLGKEEGGRSQRFDPRWARLDDSQVLEQGSDGTYGGLCRDGLVYNLEVEGTHTYIVEGIVVHNCHSLPDIARDVLGWRVTRGTCDQVAAAIGGRDPVDADLADDLKAEASIFFEALLDHARSDAYRARLRRPGEADPGDLPGLLEAASAALYREAEGSEAKRRVRLRRDAQRASAAASRLRRAAELGDPERTAYCVEVEGEGGRERAALCAKLIWPADVLRRRLFEVPGKVCIMTSATLAVDGSFDFAARELGCDVARELIVESPFDFERQALLVVPQGMPDPKRRDEHERWVTRAVVDVARASGGRLLGLFTSRRGLARAAEELYRELGGIYTVLAQGTAPRGFLIEQFRRDTSSILLGLDSFWEGVDVPGEALSVVVVDRLPFATPDDPVLDAVDALLPVGAFAEWSLPRAITALRQGAGRLIRSRADRGVVVVLDDRLVTKNYGKRFLRSLPAMPLSRDLADVRAFLDRGKIGS